MGNFLESFPLVGGSFSPISFSDFHLLYQIPLTNLNSFLSKSIPMDKQLHLKEKIKEQYGKIAIRRKF